MTVFDKWRREDRLDELADKAVAMTITAAEKSEFDELVEEVEQEQYKDEVQALLFAELRD